MKKYFYTAWICMLVVLVGCQQDDEDTVIIPYLTFSADAEQTFTMTTVLEASFQYSVGDGDWIQLTADTPITFGSTIGTLRLRGKSNIGTTDETLGFSQISFGNAGVKVACSGDIRTLIDYANYSTASTADARFYYLFMDCTQLISAPDLPATTLASYCYNGMFRGCTGLTEAPALPATILSAYCYNGMFRGCTSLTSAPVLPATTMTNYCYYFMFADCTGLTSVPVLPATTLASGCYNSMFRGCPGLTEAPTLPATTLVEECYSSMFRNCSNLNKVTMLATDISADWCMDKWLAGVADNGTFIKSASMASLPTNSDSGIPSGWTIEDYNP